jgi:hypothetical protein
VLSATVERVRIVKSITLPGWLSGAGSCVKFVVAENGHTRWKSAQPGPGGRLGILPPSFLPRFLQELFNEFINKGIALRQGPTAPPPPTLDGGPSHVATRDRDLLPWDQLPPKPGADGGGIGGTHLVARLPLPG